MGSQFNSQLWGSSLFGGAGGASTIPTTAVSDILYAAFRIAGILKGPGHGYDPTSVWGRDGLRALNAMLGVWDANSLAVPGIVLNTYTLVIGQQDYGIGPTGPDFIAVRPQRIVRANVLWNTSPVIRRKLDLWDTNEWASIRLQDIVTIPSGVYNDEGSPNAGLHFHPIPDFAYQFELYTWQLIGAFPDATTGVLLPPEYEEAVTYNLAQRLASLWGTQITETGLQIAQTSFQWLQSMNARSPKLRAEPGLRRRGGGGNYSWLTGMDDS